MRIAGIWSDRLMKLAAWVPAVALFAALALLTHQMLPSPSSTNDERTKLAWVARREAGVFALNLALLTGNSLLFAWFLTLRAIGRSTGASPAVTYHILGAAVVAVGFGSLWAVALQERVGGEVHFMMALFVYAPTLCVSCGLLGLAATRIRQPWRVAVGGLALAAIHLATQFHYLEPGGQAPSESFFALSGLAIAAAVAIWLTSWSLPPRPSPALPAR